MLNGLLSDLHKLKNPKKAKILERFFKTGKGEYGEGDVFLGIIVPEQRNIAKKYKDLSLDNLQELLKSKMHEERLVALLILVQKYQKANKIDKALIVDFYLTNIKYINNWDLVDLSAEKILGEFYLDKEKSNLYKLANSENIWERRIAIMTTFQFIKNNRFDDTLELARRLLKDKHDLIQKATGWMLREIGKRNQIIEEDFLKKHYKTMPRTMLRYAIERFDERKRRFYLKREIV